MEGTRGVYLVDEDSYYAEKMRCARSTEVECETCGRVKKFVDEEFVPSFMMSHDVPILCASRECEGACFLVPT